MLLAIGLWTLCPRCPGQKLRLRVLRTHGMSPSWMSMAGSSGKSLSVTGSSSRSGSTGSATVFGITVAAFMSVGIGLGPRTANPAFADLTGCIRVPVLALHETGDGRVPWRLQQEYRRRTLAAGTGDLLVQRAIRWPGHCAFDGEVTAQALDDLVAWIERGIKPDRDDVLAADVSTLGLRWTPLFHPEDSARLLRGRRDR